MRILLFSILLYLLSSCATSVVSSNDGVLVKYEYINGSGGAEISIRAMSDGTITCSGLPSMKQIGILNHQDILELKAILNDAKYDTKDDNVMLGCRADCSR